MAEIYNIAAYRNKNRFPTNGALALQPQHARPIQSPGEIIPFPQRQEQRGRYSANQVRGEHAYHWDKLSASAQSLVAEVERVAQQERAKGQQDSEPWYHLKGTGFFVQGQIELFLKDIQEEIDKGKSPKEAVTFASVKVQEDVKGFEYEYLKQLAGLQWNIGWRDVDGIQKLQGLDYNGAILEDLTGKQEREGALYDAWFTDRPGKPGIESWLRAAPVGSKAILVSPSGWSGYDDFTYPQTQIYYVEVGEGKNLKAFTLRYDASLTQNEQLQQELGIIVPYGSTEKQRIKNMLGSPIFITPDGVPQGNESPQRVHSPEDVITLMQKIKGSDIAFADNSFGERSFDDIRAFVRNPQQFLTRHPEAQDLIDTFQEFVRWEFAQKKPQEEIRQHLEIALAVIVVHLKGLYLGRAGSSEKTSRRGDVHVVQQDAGTRSVPLGRFQQQVDYQKEYEEIQKLPGCAGGGDKMKVGSLGTTRTAESSSSSKNYDFDHDGTCVVCGEGPTALGPCNICKGCDASMGGKAASVLMAG